MAHKIRQLIIDRVDLVDKGANPLSHIVLYKREILQKTSTGGVAMTTAEVLDVEEQRQAWQRLRWAFFDAIDSIAEYATPADQPALFLQSVEEFAATARSVLDTLGLHAARAQRAIALVDTLVRSESVAKAGRVIATQRLKRLKDAVAALQAIIEESEPMAIETSKRTTELDEFMKRATTAEAEVITLLAKIATIEDRNAELTTEVAKLQPVDAWAGISVEVRKRIEDAETAMETARGEIRKRDAITEVVKYDALPLNPDDDWELFDHVNRLLPDVLRKRFYTVLQAAQAIAKTSGVLQAQGVRATGEHGTAYAQIVTLAKGMVAAGRVPTIEQGIDLTVQENPSLYAASKIEEKGA